MSQLGRAVLVWDAPTRLFHWLTATLLAAAYVTAQRDALYRWHLWCGETLLALLLFRLFWGFAGSETARFASLIATPDKAVRHLQRLWRREPDTQVGHNPAGGWMVLVMLALLLGETLSGVFVNNDVANEGPLTERLPAWFENLVTDLHTTLSNALLAAIALHLLAIGIYGAVKHQNLLRPMFTGRKRLPDAVPAPRTASVGLALLLLGCAVAAAALIADNL